MGDPHPHPRRHMRLVECHVRSMEFNEDYLLLPIVLLFAIVLMNPFVAVVGRKVPVSTEPPLPTIQPTITGGHFQHPGVVVNQAQLDLIRSQVASKSDPMYTAFLHLQSSRFGGFTWNIQGPPSSGQIDCAYSSPDLGCTAEDEDSVAAVAQALLWYITGDQRYAANAIAILNAYASGLTNGHTNTNGPMQAAWAGEKFPLAAEILRYTDCGWSDSDFNKFKTMLQTQFMPYLVNSGESDTNGNEAMSMLASWIGIAVVLDDPVLFGQGIDRLQTVIPAYFYYFEEDGPGVRLDDYVSTSWNGQKVFNAAVSGVCQETCRDLQRTQFGLAAMFNGMETAWIQGTDLYTPFQKRLTKAMELHAGMFPTGFTDISSRGTKLSVGSNFCKKGTVVAVLNPTFETGYFHYHGRKGVSLPATLAHLQSNVRKIDDSSSYHGAMNNGMAFESLHHGAPLSGDIPTTPIPPPTTVPSSTGVSAPATTTSSSTSTIAPSSTAGPSSTAAHAPSSTAAQPPSSTAAHAPSSTAAQPPTSTPSSTSPPTTTPPSGPVALSCTSFPSLRTVTVHDASTLKAALLAAMPGDLIYMADGVYSGNIVVSVSGTLANPITLCGSSSAIIDGGGGGYVFYLNKVNYWNIVGIQVQNGQKGVMLDTSSYNLLSHLTVHDVQMEGVHFRTQSTYNRLEYSNVYNTGMVSPAYGEGVYMGSSKNNLVNDKSDFNQVMYNQIGPGVHAECIDIKEYSSSGLIEGNILDGRDIAGQNSADSWVDVKGNGYMLKNNIGKHASPSSTFLDGIQTHELVTGWGSYNVFDGNTMEVNGAGYGIRVATTTKNIVRCTNTQTGAALGLANYPCSDNAIGSTGSLVTTPNWPSFTVSSTFVRKEVVAADSVCSVSPPEESSFIESGPGGGMGGWIATAIGCFIGGVAAGAGGYHFARFVQGAKVVTKKIPEDIATDATQKSAKHRKDSSFSHPITINDAPSSTANTPRTRRRRSSVTNLPIQQHTSSGEMSEVDLRVTGDRDVKVHQSPPPLPSVEYLPYPSPSPSPQPEDPMLSQR